MTEFKVDLEAMAALVESLNSFEEKMKEYDVEDWVPNSGMLENRLFRVECGWRHLGLLR